MSLSFSHAFDAILSSTSALSGLLNTCWPKRGVKPRRHMRRRRKERRRQLQRAVRPLPSLRERSLTIPLDDAAQVHTRKSTTRSQLTHNQPQSNFFNKLPPELRMQVYSHVFADEQIPIVKDSRLRYVTWMPQTRSLMPLLLTCRRIYSEAVDLLYSQPEFFFNDFDTICLFSISVLRKRLDLIQCLTVEWDCVIFWLPGMSAPPPFDRYTWYKVWEILSDMKGLRELRVRIWNGPTMSSSVERHVFEPLQKVTSPKVFELELPWEAEDRAHERVHRDAPFKVTRVKRDYVPEL